MRWQYFLCLLSVLLATQVCVNAQTPQVTASLSDKKAPLNREVTLTVTVTNAGQQSAQVTEFPDLPQFQVMGRTRSTNVQIIQNQMSSSISWHYTLLPQREGSFTIPPVKVTVGNQIHSTRPLSIEITAASSPLQDGARQTLEDPFSGGRQFVDVELSKPEVYVNEPFTYTFRYYSTAVLPTLDSPRYERPDFQGFWIKEWPTQGMRREVVDGTTYRVQEIHATLFPQNPGKHTIAAPTLRVPGLSFFDRPRVLRGTPVEIAVKPIPQQGKPASYAGAVGSYELRASVDRALVTRGDALTLSIQIQGRGHFESLVGPMLPELPGFTQYDPTVRSEFVGNGPEPQGYKIFEHVLIPDEADEKSIPSIQWSYFDPEDGRYHELSTSPIRLAVRDAPTSQNPVTNPSPTSVATIEDIRNIRPDSVAIANHASRFYAQPLFWIWQIGWASVLGAIWIYTRHRSAIHDPFRRRQLARQTMQKILELELHEGSSQVFAAELDRVLREYLIERWGFSNGRQPELERGEQADGVSEWKTTRDLLERLEHTRFSPIVIEPDERREILTAAREAVEGLEAQG